MLSLGYLIMELNLVIVSVCKESSLLRSFCFLGLALLITLIWIMLKRNINILYMRVRDWLPCILWVIKFYVLLKDRSNFTKKWKWSWLNFGHNLGIAQQQSIQIQVSFFSQYFRKVLIRSFSTTQIPSQKSVAIPIFTSNTA